MVVFCVDLIYEESFVWSEVWEINENGCFLNNIYMIEEFGLVLVEVMVMVRF